MHMIYPKLKCEEKKNTKICSVKHQKMNEMRQKGYGYNEIADKFDVSQRTAWVHTAPLELVERSKKKRKEAMRIEHKEKYNNPKYKKKIINATVDFARTRYNHDPEFRKYHLGISAAFIAREIKKHPTWSNTCAIGKHEGSNFGHNCQNIKVICKCPCHT